MKTYFKPTIEFVEIDTARALCQLPPSAGDTGNSNSTQEPVEYGGGHNAPGRKVF